MNRVTEWKEKRRDAKDGWLLITINIEDEYMHISQEQILTVHTDLIINLC
jgi:hypothetical protein